MDTNNIIFYIILLILFGISLFRKKITKYNKKLMLYIDLFMLIFLGILFVIRMPGNFSKIVIAALIIILIIIKIVKFNKKDIFSDEK